MTENVFLLEWENKHGQIPLTIIPLLNRAPTETYGSFAGALLGAKQADPNNSKTPWATS